MEKKLSDYLHLYLGAECRIGDDNNPHYVLMVNETKLSICTGTNHKNIPIWYKTAHSKLVLRHLSDLTDEEIIEVAKISDAFPVGWSENKAYFKIQDIEHPNTGKEIVCGDKYAIRITYKYAIYYFNYVNQNGAIYLPNSIEIFRYLLSKHFDLFNLIPDGLAISKPNPSQP